MFASTREFHDARLRWIEEYAKPKLCTLSSRELEPEKFVHLEDLTDALFGKRGVFFPLAQCFYYIRHVVNNGPTIGFAKLLVSHPGVIFIAFDDIQGNAIQELCLTKTMEMEILPNFNYAHQNYTFEVNVIRTVVQDKKIAKTRVELRDEDQGGALVAISSGEFVQTKEVLAAMHEQIGQDKNELWEEMAPLRLAGNGPTDPNMSFVLRLPRPIFITEGVIPSWWGDKQVQRRAPKRSPFEGRFEIYNVEFTKQGGVRAVVLPLLTSEGPPNYMHGGGGASASIEVLLNLIPDLRVKKYAVRFRRPILLEVKMVIEWKQGQGDGVWNGLILDWQKNVLQEVTVVAYANAGQVQGKL